MNGIEGLTTTGSERAHENPWFSVWRDDFIRPDGKSGQYFFIDPGMDAVVVVAEDSNGDLILVGQTRYPVGSYLYEFPAGAVTVGEDPLSAAKRELREETGYTAGVWDLLGEYFTSSGLLKQRMHVFLARGLVSGESAPEEMEDILVKTISLENIRSLRVGSQLSNLLLVPIPFYERWKAGNNS
ncbi:MAG: NUDIX hydrolase [Candidatus Moranbacteria bacterium]|nr:NUDIX hydrolase [Candidatus Moranbacteria bacterium]